MKFGIQQEHGWVVAYTFKFILKTITVKSSLKHRAVTENRHQFTTFHITKLLRELLRAKKENPVNVNVYGVLKKC